ncbi:nucleoprotein TPR-like isoform X2 [Dendronephthya gigantea]|uniref:nucleoprotein TPR-like isoform X2 n=1 Tax=Dendronephthya gigantea TaxID=151771 RepID=UPI00106BA909|nr:nucleoprotein TPR-like isoform X2 [Dendronephthya gigantea]
MWRRYERDIKALPAVERFNTDKQVPQSLPAIANIAYHENARAQDLESRVKLSEQSNRILLEELMKLQQDLKLALRQNEEMVNKERQERLVIRDKVEAAENMYNRVSMQLLRTEEKVNMEHTTLANLLNQSKEVERALAGGQQRSLMKGEQIDRYISRFRDELSELRQSNEQVQSSLRLVGEDVKNLQHRFEMQSSEFDSVNQEMKQKVKRIETESMAAVENLQRNKTTRDSYDGSTSQLKQNIESRLSEIREVVNEVKRKTDMEASERRAADQQTELNVEKVQVAVRELETKCQEVSHAASLNMREKDNDREMEKSKLTYKMAELTEETNQKALQREMQLREEAQMKFTILDKRFREEQSARHAFEKSVRHEMEKILDALKMHMSEEIQNMRQSTKSEGSESPRSPLHVSRPSSRRHSQVSHSRPGSPRVSPRFVSQTSPREDAVQYNMDPVRTEMTKARDDQTLVKMNECIALLESEVEAGKKAFEEVLHAEIVARQTQNEQTLDKCNELHEKLSVAVTTLQKAISSVTSHTEEAVEQAKHEIFAVLDNSTSTGVRGLADIDIRLTNLNKHVADLEEAIDSRPPPPSSPPPNFGHEVPASNNDDYERLNKRVDRAYKWQEGAERTLRDLSTKLQPVNGEISKLKNAIEDLENELEDRRMARLASLAEENTSEPTAPDETTTAAHDPKLEKKVKKAEDDVEKVTLQMEKLENTVNTLRTVLSQKISTEAETVKQLREIFSGDIEKIVNYFMREQRRVFVKHRPSDARVYRSDLTKDGEQEAHSMHLALLKINRWGIYEAYRMLKYKQAWFDIVANKSKTPVTDDDREKEENDKKDEDDDDSTEDKESEKDESGKEDDDEDKSDEEKESDDDDSEDEESEDEDSEDEKSEDEKSEDEKSDDDSDDDDKKDDTASEKGSDDSENEDRPKTGASDESAPSGKKK